jgi:two-component sensor histidine kinase
VVLGGAAGLAAVALRLALPLSPQQLPTITVVVTLALVTTFVGLWAGVSTALIGGLLCWYLLFNPTSWSLANEAAVPLLGFAIIATTIISTASLYRGSERRWHAKLVSEADQKADEAVLFAREMAHRLKNALAIVQSMSFQTIGREDPKAVEFAARLRTLAEANELLTEHVSKPVANVRDVVKTALTPFQDATRLESHLVDANLPDSQVINLALALHELGTNATKYGAWSAHGGKVSLLVQDTGNTLRLTWIEEGGPRVRKPETTGFGSRLLQRAGKNATLLFEPGGVEYSVELRKAP